MTFWTEARRAELRHLWKDRAWSRKMIAAHIGCTERAICAERERLGLPTRASGKRRPNDVPVAPLYAAFDVPPPAPKPAPTPVMPVSAIPWPTRARLMAGR